METAQCRYFLKGSCSKGSQCRYAHDTSASADNICKYYQIGACMYGNSCRYDHIYLPKTTSVSPNIRVDSDSLNGSIQTCSEETSQDGSTLASQDGLLQWYEAPEFIPGRKSHVGGIGPEHTDESVVDYLESGALEQCNQLCSLAQDGECPYGEDCTYLHGDLCDMCGCLCLHPTDEEQRKEHQKGCMEHHEREMELAFAAQRTSTMSCSICLDVVKEKADITEQQFGILENCNHPFCLGCIRKWRVSSHMEKEVIRACPICRVTSWFVTPSDVWVDDPKEKKELISNYKEHLKAKHCRNFNRGKGTCKFGSSCFYKHVYEDGTEEQASTKPQHIEEEELDSEDLEGLLSALRTLLLSDSEDDSDNDSDSDFSSDIDIPGLINDSDDSDEGSDIDSGDSDMMVYVNGDLFII